MFISYTKKGETDQETARPKNSLQATLMPRKELIENSKDLLPNDTLTLVVKIIANTGLETKLRISEEKSCNETSNNGGKEESEELSEDLKKLFENIIYSDVILECDGDKLRAHKSILSVWFNLL